MSPRNEVGRHEGALFPRRRSGSCIDLRVSGVSEREMSNGGPTEVTVVHHTRIVSSVIRTGSLLALTFALGVVIPASHSSAGDDLLSPDDVADDQAAAVRLGKALFWDTQVGSDNGAAYACASCHYQGGADSNEHRIAAGVNPDGKVGSLGVQFSDFMGVNITNGNVMPKDMMAFNGVMNTVGGWMRTGRQAPPAIESDNTHNFWDGRANAIFNGLDPSGVAKDGLYKRDSNGDLAPARIAFADLSQASQAVGPPNNSTEMAAAGRSFAELGYKLMRLQPLGMQYGDLADELADSGETYGDLIEAAYGNGLGDFIGDEIVPGVTATVMFTGDPTRDPTVSYEEPVSLTENNMSLFFGLAIAAYEKTLTAEVPTPTKKQVKAFKRGKCAGCHNIDGSSHAKTNDEGRRSFASSGVEDAATGDPGVVKANLNVDSPEPLDEKVNRGIFKSSHLFNLALTPPYFHDGSAATIEDVMEFYLRGGNPVSQKVDSHVRKLTKRLKKGQAQLIIDMMRELEDPRVGAGAGPYAHPSLEVPLGENGQCLTLEPSSEEHGGLDYSDPYACGG